MQNRGCALSFTWKMPALNVLHDIAITHRIKSRTLAWLGPGRSCSSILRIWRAVSFRLSKTEAQPPSCSLSPDQILDLQFIPERITVGVTGMSNRASLWQSRRTTTQICASPSLRAGVDIRVNGGPLQQQRRSQAYMAALVAALDPSSSFNTLH